MQYGILIRATPSFKSPCIRDTGEISSRSPLFKEPSMAYRDYLKTSDWNDKRSKTYKRCNYRCQICGATDLEVHAHHIKYGDLSKVCPIKDLMCLCKRCHFKLHEYMQDSLVMSWKMFKGAKRKPTKKQYKKYVKKTFRGLASIPSRTLENQCRSITQTVSTLKTRPTKPGL